MPIRVWFAGHAEYGLWAALFSGLIALVAAVSLYFATWWIELDDKMPAITPTKAHERGRRIGGPLVGAVALLAPIGGVDLVIGDDVIVSDLDRSWPNRHEPSRPSPCCSCCPVSPVVEAANNDDRRGRLAGDRCAGPVERIRSPSGQPRPPLPRCVWRSAHARGDHDRSTSSAAHRRRKPNHNRRLSRCCSVTRSTPPCRVLFTWPPPVISTGERKPDDQCTPLPADRAEDLEISAAAEARLRRSRLPLGAGA